MREVIPGLVWIGNARDGRDVTGILALEIEAVVHVAIEEPPCLFPREIIYCRFPLLDGEGNACSLLKTAVQTVSLLIAEKVPTLVACKRRNEPISRDRDACRWHRADRRTCGLMAWSSDGDRST